MKILKAIWRRVTRRGKRAELVKVKLVSAAELEGMFREAPGSRLWEGTLAALDQVVQECVQECLDEALSNEVLRNRIGAVDGLLRFRAVLEDHEAKARERESEEEEKEGEG